MTRRARRSSAPSPSRRRTAPVIASNAFSASGEALPLDALLRQSSRQLLRSIVDLGGMAEGWQVRQVSSAFSKCAEQESFSSLIRWWRHSAASLRARTMTPSSSAMSAGRASPRSWRPRTGMRSSITRSRRTPPARKPGRGEWKKTLRQASSSSSRRCGSCRDCSRRLSKSGATASSVAKTGSKSGGRSSSSAVSLTMRCRRLSMVRTFREP